MSTLEIANIAHGIVHNRRTNANGIMVMDGTSVTLELIVMDWILVPLEVEEMLPPSPPAGGGGERNPGPRKCAQLQKENLNSKVEKLHEN